MLESPVRKFCRSKYLFEQSLLKKSPPPTWVWHHKTNYKTISLDMYYDGWLGMATTLRTYDMFQKTDFSLSFTFMTLTGWKPSSFT